METAGEQKMMTENPKRTGALLIAAAPVLVAGSVAWVFPSETAAVLGHWALPALSLSALFLALGLAIEWRGLRILLVVLATTLVLGWNRSSATSTSHFAGACLGLLLMLVVGRAVDTQRRMRLAMLTFLSTGMVMLFLGLAGASLQPGTPLVSMLPVKLPGIRLGLSGLAGGDVNPNALAAAVLLVAPLAMSVLILGTREKTDWLGLLPLAFAVAAMGAVIMAISRSRTAWIAVWLILVGLLVRSVRSALSRFIVGAFVAAPLFVVSTNVVFLSQEEFAVEASHFWQTAHDRAEIMTQGLACWRQSPWLGVGLNEFRSMYKPADIDLAHAHNIFLQIALDVGAVGSAAYWGLMTFLFMRAGQAAKGPSGPGRSAAAGSAISLVAVILFGLLDAVPLGSKIGLFQWMTSGLILAAWRTRSVVNCLPGTHGTASAHDVRRRCHGDG